MEVPIDLSRRLQSVNLERPSEEKDGPEEMEKLSLRFGNDAKQERSLNPSEGIQVRSLRVSDQNAANGEETTSLDDEIIIIKSLIKAYQLLGQKSQSNKNSILYTALALKSLVQNNPNFKRLVPQEMQLEDIVSPKDQYIKKQFEGLLEQFQEDIEERQGDSRDAIFAYYQAAHRTYGELCLLAKEYPELANRLPPEPPEECINTGVDCWSYPCTRHNDFEVNSDNEVEGEEIVKATD